jgi:signal transduction histidine kinase
MKHAQASYIEVSLNASEGYQVIRISDNGKGFDLDKLSDSNGLQNIRSRAYSIDAIVEINSTINQGTLITINIPIDEQTKA